MTVTIDNHKKNFVKPVLYKGETRTLGEWAQHLDLDYSVVRMRFIRGKTGDALFHKTKNKFNDRQANGKPKHPDYPSIFQTLDWQTRADLLSASEGKPNKMKKIIQAAIRYYLDEGIDTDLE